MKFKFSICVAVAAFTLSVVSTARAGDDDDASEEIESANISPQRQCILALREQSEIVFNTTRDVCRKQKKSSDLCTQAKAELEIAKMKLKSDIAACISGMPADPGPVVVAPAPVVVAPAPVVVAPAPVVVAPAPVVVAPAPVVVAPAPVVVAPAPVVVAPAPVIVAPAPMGCSFAGKNVASGQIVTAFQATSVQFGMICSSEARTCTDGSLSGAFQFSSCSVAQAPILDGAAIYTQNCSSCHGALASSNKGGSSAALITSAITSIGSMKSRASLLALTPAEISAIAKSLGGTP